MLSICGFHLLLDFIVVKYKNREITIRAQYLTQSIAYSCINFSYTSEVLFNITYHRSNRNYSKHRFRLLGAKRLCAYKTPSTTEIQILLILQHPLHASEITGFYDSCIRMSIDRVRGKLIKNKEFLSTCCVGSHLRIEIIRYFFLKQVLFRPS